MNPTENQAQYDAIHSDGPTLVIAGPGTGKTYTIIQRVLYLIRDKKVPPEQIMVVTYTVKASKELITRLTNELSKQGIEVNLHEMYIGTFHHICRRLLKEFREYTRLERNFIETDQFEQQYLVYGNLSDFEQIPGFDNVVPSSYLNRSTGMEVTISPWRRCKKICEYVNRLSEELVNPEDMVREKDSLIRALGWMMIRYRKLAKEKNFLDFTRLQTEAYYILSEKEAVRKEAARRIRYILVDEYQDTNYIQEKLVQLLGGEEGNIFVVGDDDQSIYRFRGATVANILRFPDHFGGHCHVVTLNRNYRSNQGIITFCMKWMAQPSWFSWERKGKLYRYRKGRVLSASGETDMPTVVRITASNNEPRYEKRVCDFVENLKKEGCITDYNQVAFLFDSVKGDNSIRLQYALKQRGIPVYAPRSGYFFKRKEVAWLLGSLLYLFPEVQKALGKSREMGETEGISGTYRQFLIMAETMMGEHQELKQWLDEEKKKIASTGRLTSNLLPLTYRILSMEPFSSFIDQAAEGECGEARNLSTITRLISRFDCFIEENHGYGKETVDDIYVFFSRYLRLWYENGVGEYEDEEAYAPSGQVSFLNIHQSKGLEYPVVIAASLDEYPRGEDTLIARVVEKMTGRRSYEPYGDIRDFDFRRKYYTAFSRAESLLVLACDRKPGQSPSRVFEKPVDSVPEYDTPGLDFRDIPFEPVTAGRFKPRLSFTSQVALYEECPLKYKLNKIYRFASPRGLSLLYGTLVHEVIEDVHRAVIRKEMDKLVPANIYAWMMADYNALSKTENTWLSRSDLDRAFQEILGYVSYRQGDWSMVKEAEYPLELVKDRYIMDGTIDLLQDKEGKTDIIDFKTGHRPKPGSSLLERYAGQLRVYAYLVEKKLGVPVGRLLLYFTGEEDRPVYEVDNRPELVQERIEAFDRTAERIMVEDFNHRAEKSGPGLPEACRSCQWRYYCWKE